MVAFGLGAVAGAGVGRARAADCGPGPNADGEFPFLRGSVVVDGRELDGTETLALSFWPIHLRIPFPIAGGDDAPTEVSVRDDATGEVILVLRPVAP